VHSCSRCAANRSTPCRWSTRVVTDSGSIHATGSVAADSDAAVVRQGDVLRQHGDIPGKGEALCESLSVTDGGIVVFIDAGLGRFDAQFAVGPVGPLVRGVGLDAMAQVDLGCREHRNFGDTALGQMAAQAQLAVLFRLQRHDRAPITGEPSTLLTVFVREDGVLVADTAEVGIMERPPIVELDPRRRRVRDSV
jgi:hypothetical protein